MAFPINRALMGIQHTPVLLETLLRGVDDERARQARDGDGWNVTEILCHLSEYETFFTERIQTSSQTDPPRWTAYDPDALAREHHYAEQSFSATLAALLDKRRALVAYLNALPEADWSRQGVHPTLGTISVLDQVLVVVFHDVNHMEQMARALGVGERFA